VVIAAECGDTTLLVYVVHIMELLEP
jgi:hypothetical protein